MKFWLKKSGSGDFTGPATLDEIRAQTQTGTISWDYEAIEAAGQTFSALKQSTGWIALSAVCPPESVPKPRAHDIAVKRERVGGASNEPEIEKLLRVVAENQVRQLEQLRAIRWAIVGFSIWFIIQFWFLPKLLAPR